MLFRSVSQSRYVKHVRDLIDMPFDRGKRKLVYGDGHAAERIVDFLITANSVNGLSWKR